MSAEIQVTKKFEFYCYLEEKGTSPFCRSQEKAQASRADPGARLTSATWNRAGSYQVPVPKFGGRKECTVSSFARLCGLQPDQQLESAALWLDLGLTP